MFQNVIIVLEIIMAFCYWFNANIVEGGMPMLLAAGLRVGGRDSCWELYHLWYLFVGWREGRRE